MRRFLLLGHTQKTEPPLPLNDPAGAGGRWDLLARCVTSGLLVSHGVRTDTEVILALLAGPRPRTVRVAGAEVRRLNPDERSTVALLSRALEATDVGQHESQPLPGVYVSGTDLRTLLSTVPKGSLVRVHEGAAPSLEAWAPSGSDVTFVLSDHRDPTPPEHQALQVAAAGELNLGPVSLHADQCLTLLHNRLDRMQASPLRRGGSLDASAVVEQR